MIRLHAYKRIEKKKMMSIRELAWVTYISPLNAINSKRMKKSIDAFWPIEKPKPLTTELMRKRIKEAQEKYFEELKKKENG